MNNLKASKLSGLSRMELKPNDSDFIKDKTFVLTGVFDLYKRDILSDIIKSKGGYVKSSVSTKVDYLLVGHTPGDTKLNRAKELGIKIILEQDIIKYIESR